MTMLLQPQTDFVSPPQEAAAFFEKLSREINEMEPTAGALRASRTAHIARTAGQEGFALFFEGEAACLEGNLDAGEELERAAVRLLPDVPFVLANFGVLLSMQGRVAESLHYLNQSLALRPNDLLALGQRGVCLAKLYRHAEALLCFDRVLALDPRNLHALRNKGVSLSRLGREREGLICLERVLAIDPTDTHALSERKILKDELLLKGTPLGRLLLWVRKRFIPYFRRTLSRPAR